MPQQGSTLPDRLWPRLAKDSPGGCWEWTGHRNGDGYGLIRDHYARKFTHRAAWELTFGLIPDNLRVLHRCDNPPCCNPSHLFLGTQTDNIADMVKKGRQISLSGDDHWSHRSPERVMRGNSHPRSKLTVDTVREARSLVASGNATVPELAHRHGVSVQVMRRAINGKTWSHL